MSRANDTACVLRCAAQGGTRAGRDLADTFLHQRPARLNRIEVVRVGRQESQDRTRALDQLAHLPRFVCRQVVHDHDITATQTPNEMATHPRDKASGVHRAPVGRQRDAPRLESSDCDRALRTIVPPTDGGKVTRPSRGISDLPAVPRGRLGASPLLLHELHVAMRRGRLFGESKAKRTACNRMHTSSLVKNRSSMVLVAAANRNEQRWLESRARCSTERAARTSLLPSISRQRGCRQRDSPVIPWAVPSHQTCIDRVHG